jgi:N-methylhydantoinase A
MMLLGIDTGGTFTDFVLLDGNGLRSHKVLSTPDSPEQAILRGIDEMGITLDGLHIIHGSTVATNAVLEGKLAKTVYITNQGLADTLTIGRQARRELYNLQPAEVSPPVTEQYCLEVDCRVDAQGRVLRPLGANSVQALLGQIEELKPQAVAINLLFSFIEDRHEKELEASMPDHLFVTRSSSLLPVYREYERGIGTWLNAATGPLMEHYLHQLSKDIAPATLSVIQSSGDTVDARQATLMPATLLLSGPAGGLMGAKTLAGLVGKNRIMTFDMGGTSTDVALIDGDIQLTDEGKIAHYPVSVPMVDMHTIGAGGGSMAWLDEGNVLQVGPQSAGAMPGPACYAMGGTRATVTDANLVLGHLPSQVALGGSMGLDYDAALKSMKPLADQMGCTAEQTAEGITRLANEHMAQALRVISIEKGFDPKEFMLVSFGGAGGLHACDLAEALEMSAILVPIHAGVLSALGMLAAPRGRRYTQTHIRAFSDLDTARVEQLFQVIQREGRKSLLQEGLSESELSDRREVDLRYVGQASTIRVQWSGPDSMRQAFQTLHERRYGHALNEEIELVNLHVSVHASSSMPALPEIGRTPAHPLGTQTVYAIGQQVSVYERLSLGAGQTLHGPVILIEPSATTWVKPGWQVVVNVQGSLEISRE